MWFREGEAWAIAERRKTVTFQVKPPRGKAGETYPVQVAPKAKNAPPGEVVATIRIKSIDETHLGEITDRDIELAGYHNYDQMRTVWANRGRSWYPTRRVWRIEFEVISVERSAA
jgi:hypothetical protein